MTKKTKEIEAPHVMALMVPASVLRETYGFTNADLAILAGISVHRINIILAGKIFDDAFFNRMREMCHLLQTMVEIFKPEAILPWFRKPSEAFIKNRSPLEVVGMGRIDLLWNMVHDIASGAPS